LPRHPALHWILGLALGLVFLAASRDKIWKPRDFARIVYHYQIIGPNATLSPLIPNAFAVTLPWVEAVTGLCLALGVWRREAATVAAALLFCFLLAVASAMARGLDIENCGCFSVTGATRRAGLTLLAEDLALLLGAVVLARSGWHKGVDTPGGGD
jgi:putative oxidoreductase